MEYKISRELAEAVINYLASKPFKEVNGLIGLLGKLQPIVEPKPEVKKETPKPETPKQEVKKEEVKPVEVKK